jgi:hypothetical protein
MPFSLFQISTQKAFLLMLIVNKNIIKTFLNIMSRSLGIKDLCNDFVNKIIGDFGRI